MDECPKQLIGEVRTPIPPRKGEPLRYDSEYYRISGIFKQSACNLTNFVSVFLLLLIFTGCSSPAGSESNDIDTAVYNAINTTVNPNWSRNVSRELIVHDPDVEGYFYNTLTMRHYLEAEAPEGKVYTWTTDDDVVNRVTSAIMNAYPQAKISPLWNGKAEKNGEPTTKISFYRYNSDSGRQSFGVITRSGPTSGSSMDMRTFMLEPRSGTVIADAVRTGTKIKEDTNSEGSKFYIVKVEKTAFTDAFSEAKWNELVSISNGTKSCAFYFSGSDFSAGISVGNNILINVVSYGYCRILGADKTAAEVADYEANSSNPNNYYYAVTACYYNASE
jgi:hypothetical protein